MLNTQEVRLIGFDMEQVSLDRARSGPVEWKEHPAHVACCTQCGVVGKKKSWYTRQDGVNARKLCPACMQYQRDNLAHAEQPCSESDEQPVVSRLARATENLILEECA